MKFENNESTKVAKNQKSLYYWQCTLTQHDLFWSKTQSRWEENEDEEEREEVEYIVYIKMLLTIVQVHYQMHIKLLQLIPSNFTW